MIDEVRHRLMDIEEENERLESELRSPSLGRLTEYAMTRESGDPTLRSIGWTAERLELSIRDLTDNSATLPPIH